MNDSCSNLNQEHNRDFLGVAFVSKAFSESRKVALFVYIAHLNLMDYFRNTRANPAGGWSEIVSSFYLKFILLADSC